MRLTSVICLLFGISILVIFPPTSLNVILADFSLLLGIFILSLAIRFTPKYSGPKRDLFILSMGLLAILFTVIGFWLLSGSP